MKKLLSLLDNENPLYRVIRVGIMAGIAAAALAIATALPGVDLPGQYDALIIGIAVPVLTGIDKWARARE